VLDDGRHVPMLRAIVAAALACGLCAGSAAAATRRPAPPPRILSAFFGLDDALPLIALGLCPVAPGQDGMPLVFTSEIDERTLYPWDFTVTTRSGQRLTPICATTAPANEESEDRTVLLIGQFGNARSDPPEQVAVSGGLLDEQGRRLAGLVAPVIPLSAGPALVYAEPAPPESNKLTYAPLSPSVIQPLQKNSACPAGTVQRVRVTWDGGVSAPGGGEVGDAQRLGYFVAFARGPRVHPFALGDLGDHDNNHLLCLKTHRRPTRVTATAGLFLDPGGDRNLRTSVAVTYGN
jgi:hypothetical protein